MHWRNSQNNLMNPRWIMMGLLPWRIFQEQQQRLLLKSPHMGLSSLCLGCNNVKQNIWNNQVRTPLTCSDLSWSLTISCRIIRYGSKPRNWSCLTSISYSVRWWIFHCSIHKGRHNTPKLDRSSETQLK